MRAESNANSKLAASDNINSHKAKRPSRFAKILSFIKAIDDGINYDPEEQRIKTNAVMKNQIQELTTRVQNLENSETRKQT